MKVKTNEASGPVLDWMVTYVLYGEQAHYIFKHNAGFHRYSTVWERGGPIIDGEGITTAFCSGDLCEPRSYWVATTETQSWEYGYGPYHEQDEDKSLDIYKSEVIEGPTPLIAAMRCYVASKLGDEVEVPDELA